MTEEINNKVINIFQRHKKGDHFFFPVEEGGEMVISPDGFNYVTLKQPKGNGNGELDAMVEIAERKHYIVKFVEDHKDSLRIDSFHVPGGRLEEFLSSLEKRPGKLVEIKPFYPDQIG